MPMRSSSTQAGASVQMQRGLFAPLPPRPLRAEAACASISSELACEAHAGPWPARLRRAIDEGLFVLHYQPVVSLDGGAVSHFEALLRLADLPDGRLIAPLRFLPIAERCGLVRQIDRLVLAQAIALMAQPVSGRRMPVAVNLSAMSVAEPDMIGHVERLLAAHEVDPARLIVEITETAAIGDIGRAHAFCAGLRALGCSIALDDFGSGYGSFRYLKRLPFDFLKIDGDFIRALPSSYKDQLVVQALVRVAAGLGKRTIAEYVSGPETVALLQAYGVDYGQGFGLGRPSAPVHAFAAAAA